MRSPFAALAASAIILTGIAPDAASQSTEGHKILTPAEIKWGPGPASIPPGAEAAVLHGDPAKEGMFALRLKLPKGYKIAPHSHPRPEVVTVITGTFRLGMGEVADHGQAKPLPAGSFFGLPAGMTHFAFTDEDTIVQLNGSGPWAITYVNPKDDPRQKKGD